jgi:hypothetical protein
MKPADSTGSWHTCEITDSAGEAWTARQHLGVGGSTHGDQPLTQAEFVHHRSGRKLSGRVSAFTPATPDDLSVALKEAQLEWHEQQQQ